MKKTISLVLVFAFVFTLALQLPVLAEDNMATITETPVLITPAPAVTSSSLEKIPSEEYIKYFREIRKIGDSLFGVRKPATEIEKLKQENKATSTASTTLEKIPSPTLINLYREIRKVGTDLFGIKKASSTILNITKNNDKKITSAANAIEKRVEELKKAGLEKITSLEHLNLFEKVIKVGNDLFGIKKKGAMVLPTMTPELITCISTAIDTKDANINISFTSATSEITSAVDARGVCQKAALALTTGHEDAVKACNKTFQEATKTANEKAKNSQKETWAIYKNSLKACSVTAKTTEINIEDGGEILK